MKKLFFSDNAYDETRKIENSYIELQKSFTNLVLREAKRLNKNIAWVELTTQLSPWGLNFESVALFDLVDEPIDDDTASDIVLDFLQEHFNLVINLYGWSMGHSTIEFINKVE